MKKTKILVPAAAILALGMAAAVTGTVAWFSSNTRVTASGMSITATTSKSLMISKTSATGWTNAVTVDATAVKSPVLPVSPVDRHATTNKSVHASETAGAVVTGDTAYKSYTMQSGTTGLGFYAINLDANPVADPAVYSAEHSISDAITNNKIGDAAGTGESAMWFVRDASADNYCVDDLYLLYSDADIPNPAYTGPEDETHPATIHASSAVNLTITLSLPDTSVEIWKALHVGVLKAAAQGVKTAGTVEAGDVFYDWDIGELTPSDGAATIVKNSIVTLESTVEYHFQVFAWFEGEDPQCTTANSMAAVAQGVNFAFALAE
ncbi:MAG: hypothetical protein K6C34_04500 [Alphaproteobacteria bacterium]|nr:hypothetical protein [Alphaproteobacteria bacterium]